MSEPLPPAQPPRRAPLSLGRRIGAAIAVLIMLFSGSCVVYFARDEYAAGIAFVIGGITSLVAAFVLWSALSRALDHAPPPPLTKARRIIAIIGIAVMVVTVFDALWFPAGSLVVYWPTPLESLLGFPSFVAGLPFVIGLLIWWAAIRDGR